MATDARGSPSDERDVDGALLDGAFSLLPFLAALPWPAYIFPLTSSSSSSLSAPPQSLWRNAAAASEPISALDADSAAVLVTELATLSCVQKDGDAALRSFVLGLRSASDACSSSRKRSAALHRVQGRAASSTDSIPETIAVLQLLPSDSPISSSSPIPSSEDRALPRVIESDPPPPDALEPAEEDTATMTERQEPSSPSPPAETVVEGEDAASEGVDDSPKPRGYRISQGPHSTRKMLETYDWSKSALGPRSTWPQSLLTAISLMESLDHETLIMWGEGRNIFYNDAYAEMAMSKHPEIYGKPCGEAYPEIWQYMEPNANAVFAGNAIYRTQDQFFFQSGPGGSLEESWHRWMWTPIRVEGGKVGGIFSQSIEMTQSVVAQRRLDILSKLAQGSVTAQTTEDLLELLVSSLALQPDDIPFALVYDGTLSTASSTTLSLSLFATLGVPDSHSSAPATIELSLPSSSHVPPPHTGYKDLPATDSASPSGFAESENWPWPMREALERDAPVLVEDCSALVQGFEQRSWELPRQALVVPVFDSSDPTSTRRVLFVVGLNSRLPFDAGYRSWFELLSLQVLAGLSSVLNIEAQFRRGEELAQLDRAKTSFFSNVSHELRTPLTLIQGPLSDLLAVETTSSKKSLLGLAWRNVQRLRRLVDMLMDVSRVEAGRMQGQFSPHQLGVFVSDLASMFRSAIEKGGLEYIVDCDIEEKRQVFIDPELFEKICWNLLSNSYKYCLSGVITVRVVYAEDSVGFSVSDTGVGIPREDLDKVVDRFHRVSSVSRSTEGTGIGLSFAADLIKLHRGTLKITSQTAEESPDGSHGSCFLVTLPLGSHHLPQERVDLSPPVIEQNDSRERTMTAFTNDTSQWASHFEAMGGAPSSVLSPSSEGGFLTPVNGASEPSLYFWTKSDVILIVDDNADMRRYLVSILSEHVRVIEAADGLEALDLARMHLPDLIVSDIMMSGLDGIELLARLRASEGEVSMIPVILITAKSGENERVAGLMTGAEDYLVKPFSSKELVARAHLHLQLGRRRIDLERKFASRSEELRLRAIEAEARRQQADFQRQQQELLVDVVSHEYRTPLSVVGNAALLCRDNLAALHTEFKSSAELSQNWTPSTAVLESLEQDIDALDSIIAIGHTQTRIANDIVDLAQIQRATLALRPVSFDLIQETNRVLTFFQDELKVNEIDLDLAWGPTMGSFSSGKAKVYADSARYSQILTTLISNAILFSSAEASKTISIRIELGLEPPNDDSCLAPSPSSLAPAPPLEDLLNMEPYIYVEVRDSGKKLSQEGLGLLFDRFDRAGTETHPTFGGSGLSIFVAKKLCEVMDGKIEVASDGAGEKGNNFRFYVRTAPRDGLLLDPRSTSPRRGSLSPRVDPAQAVSPPRDPLHILVVEDNVVSQKVLNRQLSKAGLTCDIANDGIEALEFITKRVGVHPPYGVTLCDLEMPRMGGIETIQRIREMERDGELPRRHTVYALTGNARQGQIDRALAAGMDDVILKPYKIASLLAKLRESTACTTPT